MEIDEFIGCTAGHLREWLESLFTPEMTWENRGTYWHVDHKLPLASFDLTDLEQVKHANNWLNLQPLEASENLRKGSTITDPQIHLNLVM